jgi:hypothetical protein
MVLELRVPRVSSVWSYRLPTLGISEGWKYMPVALSRHADGLFSIEHLIALAQGPRSGTGLEIRTSMTIPLSSFPQLLPALLLLGVPVAFSIGLSALSTLAYEGLPLAVGFQQMTSGMNIFSFLAIPFFIFAGELMLYGGIADKIVDFAKSMIGHVRGGLGMSNVVACTLFGGVSGSPVADVSAMGAVMIPMMKREGYHADYAVNVTTHAALVGALMPTSHNMIIYTLAAGGKVSIAALILAGILPALILTLCNLGAAYLVAVKRGYPAGTFPGWAIVARTFAASLPGPVRRGTDPGGHPERRVHGHRVGGRRRHLHHRAHGVHLPQPQLGVVPEGGHQGGEDHRHHPAADRHLGHLRLPDQPVRRGRTHRQGADHRDQGAVADLPAGQPDPVHPGHVPGHGGHHPAVHAHLPAHLHAVRHVARCSSGWCC